MTAENPNIAASRSVQFAPDETPSRVMVTGSAGFIGGYIVEELLRRGHTVVGVDNFSKYGVVKRSYDDHEKYTLHVEDCRDEAKMTELVAGVDYVIAGAALIGGISYFHAFAYDLLSQNEQIMASTCNAAIAAYKAGSLKKMLYMSSSMVFESTDRWPSKEGDQKVVAPPMSAYGFQKLAVEYYAQAAYDQYGLPFTVIRPFNCVGTGEQRALTDVEVASGNVLLAMSHVVPDLVQKIVKGQDPLHVLGTGDQVRHYTYGGDLARGIVTALFHPAALNEDFNISTPSGHTVTELAAVIWKKLKGEEPLRIVSDTPYEHDVQKRVPDVTKAEGVLGVTCPTTLEEMLDEVIPWIVQAVKDGTI